MSTTTFRFATVSRGNAHLDLLKAEVKKIDPNFQVPEKWIFSMKPLHTEIDRCEAFLEARGKASPVPLVPSKAATIDAAVSIYRQPAARIPVTDPVSTGRPAWTDAELLGLTRHCFHQAGASIVAMAPDLPGKFTAFERLCSVNGIKLPWQPAPTPTAWNPGSPIPRTPASLVTKYEKDIAQFAAARQPRGEQRAGTGAGTAAGIGMTDVIAAHDAISDPIARMAFYRKNKAAYDAAWSATKRK